jgi:hypothetical protein
MTSSSDENLTLRTSFIGPNIWVSRDLSLGIKQPGREADHSPPSSAEVKHAWSYTSTLQYAFKAWCLVKHRDNFTFIFILYIYLVKGAQQKKGKGKVGKMILRPEQALHYLNREEKKHFCSRLFRIPTVTIPAHAAFACLLA